MRSLLTVVSVGVVILALASPVRAQQVQVELRCWEGFDEIGPPLAQLVFDEVAKPHVCRILLANSGQELTDVTFELTFGTHPEVPLAGDPQIGGDPGAYFNCLGSEAPFAVLSPPSASGFHPGLVLGVMNDFAGFPPGDPTTTVSGQYHPYFGRCWEHYVIPKAGWRIGLPAGGTEDLRVQFRSGMSLQGASFSTTALVTAGNLPSGVTAAAAQLPILVQTPVHPLTSQILNQPSLSRTLALSGSALVGTHTVQRRGASTGTEVDFYLPYLVPAGAGWTLAIDGAYDANQGHVLLFDPGDLEINIGFASNNIRAARFRDAQSGEDTVTIGGQAIPLSQVAPDHFHMDLGYLSGTPSDYGGRYILVAWAADFSQASPAQSYLAGLTSVVTGRLCGHTSQSPEAVCATTTSPLMSETGLLDDLRARFKYQSNRAHYESDAATPLSTLSATLNAPLLPWRDVELTIATQVPNNSDGQAGEPLQWYKWLVPAPRPESYFRAAAVADNGFENDLMARAVPSGAPSDFVAVASLPTLTPPTTTELLSLCEPSRYGVRNFLGYSSGECDYLLDWRVPRDARTSLGEGSADTYAPNDMTLASLGATAQMTAVVGGDTLLTTQTSFNIEVNGASSYDVALLHDNQSQAAVWQVASPLDQSTNHPASIGCLFGNRGLDNTRGPLEIEIEWPIGFEPSALDPDPAPGLRTLYGDETIGFAGFSIVGAPVPAGSRTVVSDIASRRVSVTFDGPRTDGSFPAEDQTSEPLDYSDARWVAVRLEGTYRPGVDRFPIMNCWVTVAESVAADGTIVSDDVLIPDEGPPHRILGAPAPLLRGSSTPSQVPSGTAWTTTLDLRNAAYDAATEALLANGAAVSARDSVVYFRVPRDGDIEAALQNGPLSISFTQASSGDSRPIRVSTEDVPSLPADPDLPDATDWVLCADAGAACDSAALATIGLQPEEVRWVAFALGEALVTDAEPRGVTPTSDSDRVEAPYFSYVTMTDLASGDGVLVRPHAVFISSDTVQLLAPVGQYDVVIDNDCACTDPGAYFAPVADAAGNIVGAIRCVDGPSGVTCDTETDNDGDGRPDLKIYPEHGGMCGD